MVFGFAVYQEKKTDQEPAGKNIMLVFTGIIIALSIFCFLAGIINILRYVKNKESMRKTNVKQSWHFEVKVDEFSDITSNPQTEMGLKKSRHPKTEKVVTLDENFMRN